MVVVPFRPDEFLPESAESNIEDRWRLEVTPRFPKRDARVMHISGPVEQFSNFIENAFQQTEFPQISTHDRKVSPGVARVNRIFNLSFEHRCPNVSLVRPVNESTISREKVTI
jgi:hypothetical protein